MTQIVARNYKERFLNLLRVNGDSLLGKEYTHDLKLLKKGYTYYLSPKVLYQSLSIRLKAEGINYKFHADVEVKDRIHQYYREFLLRESKTLIQLSKSWRDEAPTVSTFSSSLSGRLVPPQGEVNSSFDNDKKILSWKHKPSLPDRILPPPLIEKVHSDLCTIPATFRLAPPRPEKEPPLIIRRSPSRTLLLPPFLRNEPLIKSDSPGSQKRPSPYVSHQVFAETLRDHVKEIVSRRTHMRSTSSITVLTRHEIFPLTLLYKF